MTFSKDAGALAGRRSQTYWLLSHLFMHQPDAELLELLWEGLLQAGDAVDADPELRLMAAAAAKALASASELTAMQVEYTRLLGGASRARGAPEPYEAMTREGRLFGESTEAVAAAYVAAGYPDLATEHGPPDHVANELRFMSLLCFREMEARRARDEPAAAHALGRQLAFLEDHVLRWLPEWCERLSECTAHPFYLALGALTSSACVHDREDIVHLLHAPA